MWYAWLTSTQIPVETSAGTHRVRHTPEKGKTTQRHSPLTHGYVYTKLTQKWCIVGNGCITKHSTAYSQSPGYPVSTVFLGYFRQSHGVWTLNVPDGLLYPSFSYKNVSFSPWQSRLTFASETFPQITSTLLDKALLQIWVYGQY